MKPERAASGIMRGMMNPRRFVAALTLSIALALLIGGCRHEYHPPAHLTGPYKPLVCNGRPFNLAEHFDVEEYHRRCPTKLCDEALQKSTACQACLMVSCCAEVKACIPEEYPPDTPARADAARCNCLVNCRLAGRSLAACASDQRCGPANDLHRAESSCLAAHCADVCPMKPGGPP